MLLHQQLICPVWIREQKSGQCWGLATDGGRAATMGPLRAEWTGWGDDVSRWLLRFFTLPPPRRGCGRRRVHGKESGYAEGWWEMRRQSWMILVSTFDFRLFTSRSTGNGRLKKEHRRRKHVYFSSVIFQLWLFTFQFQKHLVRAKLTSPPSLLGGVSLTISLLVRSLGPHRDPTRPYLRGM